MKIPLKVELVTPPTAPESPWVAPMSYMRDIAKWITGGVVATAAAVATGASLTKLGELSIETQQVRILFAIFGLVIGIAAIGRIFAFALRVFTVDTASLSQICDPGTGLDDRTIRLQRLKREIELAHDFAKNEYTWDDIALSDEDGSCVLPDLRHSIQQSAAFLTVRLEFLDLQSGLYRYGPLAIAGFVTFAWAANPADPKAPPPSPTVEVVEWQYDADGNAVRRTTRSVPAESAPAPAIK